MNMQLSGQAAILVGLVLSGCGTTPSNVRLPTLVKPGDVVDANEARYRLGDKAEDPLLSTAVNGTV
ncbi:MAG: hypothetical protein Q7K57_14760, partial [Burkholderiaceae bacterium]|nr:hypothetical protein [Burkholderiaceae bacterium]